VPACGQRNLRRHLGRGKVKSIRFRNSESDLQLADICAGAIARSLKANRDDRFR
jgi:hypothetical protein